MNVPSRTRTPLLRSTLLAVALAAATLAIATGCSSEAAPNPPPPGVSVAVVALQPMQAWDEVTGRIEAIDRVDLRPRVSGYVEHVDYVEGAEVKKGDVLFTLDARTYRAALARAQADLARARSQAAQFGSEAARASKLAAAQAISTELADQRSSAASEARANVQAAQAAVDQAQLDMDFTRVRSPISGRAGRALVTAGNLVNAGESASVLTNIVSLDRMYVDFDTDEATFLRYAGMASRGERRSERDGGVPVQVALTGEEGFPHEGVVTFVDNRVDPTTGTIRGRAVLDNPLQATGGRAFTPGLFAHVRLPGGGADKALLVDDKAVMTDQDRKYVYVVDGKGLAQRKDITLGRAAKGLRVVTSGLAAGDRVVVSGAQKVFFPGMPVAPIAVPMDPEARLVASPPAAAAPAAGSR